MGALIFLLLILALAAFGVALARTPLRRPGYWLRWAGLALGYATLALALDALFFGASAIPPPGGVRSDLYFLAPTMISALSYAVGLVLTFLWQGRRMLDAAGRKWLAMLGLLPFAFIVIGALPSRPSARLDEKEALEVFR